MTRRKVLLTTAIGLIVAMTTPWTGDWKAYADESSQEQAELAKALNSAKVSLEQGLKASEREGQPISGKFEMEDGKLQLSVYTAKDGKFFEVIVDHVTGEIAKVEPITEGEDLSHSKSQKAAMDKAKVKLGDAATKARGQVADVLTVSAIPDLKGGRPMAEVVLLTGAGKRFSTVSERLD
jgi:hypothetical protein